MVNLLLHDKLEIQEYALLIIGNISIDCVSIRDAVINSAGIKIIVQMIKKTQNVNLLQTAAWTLSNLCRGSPLPSKDKTKTCINVFCLIISKNSSEEAFINSCWGLQAVLHKDADRIQEVIESGIIIPLNEFIISENLKIAMPILKIFT